MSESFENYEKWSRRAYLGLLGSLVTVNAAKFGNDREWESIQFALEEDSWGAEKLGETEFSVLTEDLGEYSANVNIYKQDEEFYQGNIRPNNPLFPGEDLDLRVRTERNSGKDYLYVERRKE